MVLNNMFKTINNDPEKYFTEDVMKKLEEDLKKSLSMTTIVKNCCTPLF